MIKLRSNQAERLDKVKTNEPILTDQESILKDIAVFWDNTSNAWNAIWGPHIHHGFYDSKSSALSPKKAQELLIEKLCSLIKLQPNQKILDVGCGLGYTAFYLAVHYHSIVTGITLSQYQIERALETTKRLNLINLSFFIEDAHRLRRFQKEEFDIVWSLESCEQFYDKALFIQQAKRVLKPNGKLLLVTWCSSQEVFEGRDAENYISLCKRFNLPYMPTIQYYEKLLKDNFNRVEAYDWSESVKQSWEEGQAKIKQFSYFDLFKLGGFSGLFYIRDVKKLADAFLQGQIRYGVFVAEGPKL